MRTILCTLTRGKNKNIRPHILRYTFSATNSSLGTLTLIPTPIGNLKDLTPRMLRKLFQADLIGCQDRRVAGQLYTLIKGRKIVQEIVEKFGDCGKEIVQGTKQQNDGQQQNQGVSQEGQLLYQYHIMGEKERTRFLRKTFKTAEEEKHFKLQYLKYKSVKLMNQHQDFIYKQHFQKRNRNSEYTFDQHLFGIQSSDFGDIQFQIQRTRDRKGRGLLIPLNTYTETKMFDLVRLMLQSRRVAIVTDAGMPCISDPGWKIVDHIRRKMPKVKIEVIGGPSSVSILAFLANIVDSAQDNNLSGRFEGFASTQVSKVSEDIVVFNENQVAAKKQDFSIHFINARKLKKHALGLQKIYGGDHRIIIASQLTKIFQRKYHGTLKELNQILTKDETAFESAGEMSYILYPPQTTRNKQIKESQHLYNKQTTYFESNPVMSLSIEAFLDAIHSKEVEKEYSISNKQKNELLVSIFALKSNDARKRVHLRVKPKREVTDIYQKKFMENQLHIKFDNKNSSA